MKFNYSNLLEKFKEIEKSDTFIPITGAILATTIAMCGIKMIYRNRKNKKDDYKRYRMIPTPSGSLFYFGHSLALGDMPAQKITEWHKKLGSILRIKMGAQDWIFIGESSMARDIFSLEAILTSEKPHFMFGNDISRRGTSHAALADDGAKWKDVRTAIIDNMSPTSVEGFSEILERGAQRTVDQLIKRTQLFGSVDPLSVIRCASINVILSIVFGHPGAKFPYDPLYQSIMNVHGKGSEHAGFWRYFPMLSYLDRHFRNGRQMRKFVNASYSQVKELVQRARESDGDNLVKKMDLVKEENGIDEHHIIVMMSELLVAGTDTVSSSTAWTFAILCHYPEVQRKLAKEIDNFIRKHSRIPKFKDRLDIPYYNAVQKECLRFRPPVYFGVPRKTSEDVVYGNYLISKGSMIVSNIHALHNDECKFIKPREFIPERFLYDNHTMNARANKRPEDRDHYAFGCHNRICPGVALAETEIFNIVTRVMARCTIEPGVLNGQAVYPNLDDIRSRGATVLPGPFEIRFVERDDRLIV